MYRKDEEAFEGTRAPRRKARRTLWHVFAVRRAMRLGAAYKWPRKVKRALWSVERFGATSFLPGRFNNSHASRIHSGSR